MGIVGLVGWGLVTVVQGRSLGTRRQGQCRTRYHKWTPVSPMRKLCFPEGRGKEQILHGHLQTHWAGKGMQGAAATRSLTCSEKIPPNQKTQTQKPATYYLGWRNAVFTSVPFLSL